METNNFLNKKQETELNQRMWSVNPNGQFLTLYADDFTQEDIWIQICQQLQVDWTTTQKVDILYFGTQTNQ